MRPSFWRAVLLCAVAGMGFVAAIEFGAGPIVSRIDDLTAAADGDSGDIGGSASARYLPLTNGQRGRIFDGIMKIHDAPVADVPAPDATLPSSVALQDLPASVTHEIPMVQGYKFVKLDDRILLVSPLDRSVVADLPRYRTMLD
jgi:hypothetical protein